MQTKKLISYLSCEKFEQNIFESIKERYKSTTIKDAVIINIKEDQQIILFKYGVFICWNVEFENIKFFMDFIKDYQINSFKIPFIEELNYTIGEEFKINFDTIYLSNELDTSKIAISHALSQNIKLDQFEKELQDSIEGNSNIPLQLAHTGKINLNKKEISKKIGELFLVKSKINLHYDLLDTPEFFGNIQSMKTNMKKWLSILILNQELKF